jgi:hypothetical protein
MSLLVVWTSQMSTLSFSLTRQRTLKRFHIDVVGQLGQEGVEELGFYSLDESWNILVGSTCLSPENCAGLTTFQIFYAYVRYP